MTYVDGPFHKKKINMMVAPGFIDPFTGVISSSEYCHLSHWIDFMKKNNAESIAKLGPHYQKGWAEVSELLILGSLFLDGSL